MKRQVCFLALALFTALLCGPLFPAHAGVFDWPRNVDTAVIREITLQAPVSAQTLIEQLALTGGSYEEVTLIPSGGGTLLIDGAPVFGSVTVSCEALSDLQMTVQGETALLTVLARGSESRPVSLQVRTARAAAPIAQDGSLETIAGIRSYGQFAVYDPAGKLGQIEVVTAPLRGTLTLDGSGYRYTPYPDEQGTDRFTYRAVSTTGAVSNEAQITVAIDPPSAYDYADLNGSDAYYSAVRLLEHGIFCGEQIGARRYFFPEREMTRGEWIMALVSACGMDDALSKTVSTSLANDGDLPLWLKPYLAAARARGVHLGRTFLPDEVPTLAEAVVWVDRFCALSKVTRSNPSWDDFSDIPDWAVQSYLNLQGYRMLTASHNRVMPNAPLTRERAADLLWQAAKYTQTEK